jgi:hypothetical protein
MWTQTPAGDQFVQELSKELVSQFAPEELDVFDELYNEYREHPAPPQAEPGTDDALGSGLGEIIVAVTPAASAMVTAVVSFVLNEILKASQDEASEKIKTRVKAVFNPRPAEKEKVPPLSQDQLDQVRRLAARRGVDFGLPPEQARQMSLALIGSLSLK